MMAKYCELFYSFLKIGTFTIGGGYAMIPLMEQELVDRRQWMSREEFLNQLALSQSMPGVLAVNMATGLGYRLRGLRGAISAIAGNILMPIVFILILAVLFRHFRDNIFVERFFMGVRPAVVALIAAPVFRLAQSAKVAWSTCWIPILSALLIWLFDVSPILIILAAIILGFAYGRLKLKNDN
jgi:chromate transporter